MLGLLEYSQVLAALWKQSWDPHEPAAIYNEQFRKRLDACRPDQINTVQDLLVDYVKAKLGPSAS